MYSKEAQKQLNQLTEGFRLILNGNSDIKIDEGSIEQLRDIIRYHDWRYYVLNEPLITDFDYDMLFKELQSLEAQHPKLVTEDSPTQRVARGLSEDLKPVSHLVSMLSLDNSYNTKDLIEFDKRVKALTGHAYVEYCAEPKFDGSSIALVYENDWLVRAATRGDGAMGEDITNNAKALSSIPLRAPFSKYGIHRIEIRGEVIIQRSVFARMNEERKTKGEKLFQNA